MTEFAFVTVLMISFSTVLYLMVRALPRIEEEAVGEKRDFFDRWAHSELPEKFDTAFNGFLFKFLRKVKVVVLKFDNTISRHLQKMNKPEDNDSRIDFKEISGQNKEDELK